MVTEFKNRGTLRLMLTAILGLVLTGVFLAPPVLAGETLKRVRANNKIRCGVNEQLLGFSWQDENGGWRGFNIDFCRAVAAAVLGDPEKVSFIPVTTPNRFPVLLSGGVDLLAHTITWTLGREAGIGIEFPGIYFYDGQTFAVPAENKKVQSIEDLNGMTICVVKGTTHQTNMANFFSRRGIKFTPLVVDSRKDMGRAIADRRCQACTSERSVLAAMQSSVLNEKERVTILPDKISKEPLSPAVVRGDAEWTTIIRWVLFALIEAEELGVTSSNVRHLQKQIADPDLQWFLNFCGQGGKALGLKPDWVADVIAAGGNYGEIYEHNLGSGSPLKLERGLNRLWKDGGLLYSPSFQ